jgi:DNA-binding NtrC family response regulator
MMRGRRILLVDDEAQLVQLMSRYLERFGYETAAAGSTEETRRLIEEGGSFAAVIIDASLNNNSGGNLARQVLAGAPQTKVILASGYPFDVQPLAAEFPGRVVFLQKPFTGEMLAEAVKQLMGASTLGGAV